MSNNPEPSETIKLLLARRSVYLVAIEEMMQTLGNLRISLTEINSQIDKQLLADIKAELDAIITDQQSHTEE